MANYKVTGFDFRDGAPVNEIINAQSAEEVKSLYLNDGVAVTNIKKLPEQTFNFVGFGMSENLILP